MRDEPPSQARVGACNGIQTGAHNEISGTVIGSVVQAGAIHGNVYLNHRPDPLAPFAEYVAEHWQAEETARRIHNPRLLPVRWSAIEPPSADRWSVVRSDQLDEPLVRQGVVDDLAGLVRDPAHRGRVVVLGDPGAGKTTAAVRMLLGLLAARRPGGRVPLLLNLAGWDAERQSLVTWVRNRLALDYGLPAHQAPGLADLLPILDGLDEIPDAARRSAVLTAVNRTLGADTPLVVVSRAQEYHDAAAAAGGRGLTAALVVTLHPINPDEAVDYLAKAEPRNRSDRWAKLCRRDEQVRAALTAPLWCSLAKEGYAHSSADPEELCGLPDVSAIHARLLDRLLPSAYPEPADEGVDGHTWHQRQVARWLTFLASHVGTDLAWWRLAELVPGKVRDPIANVALTLPFVLLMTVSAWHSYWLGGPVGGIALLVIGVVAAVQTADTEYRLPLPSWRRIRPGLRHRSTPVAVRVICLLLISGPVGFLPGSMLPTLYHGDSMGSMEPDAFPVGLAGWGAALVIGTLVEFTTLFAQDADPLRPVPPTELISRDRTRSLVIFLVVTVGVTGVALLLMPWIGALVLGLGAGLACGFLTRPWGWFTLTRLWLAVTRRLPWRLSAFLADAHRRGVLRQTGGSYEFRHVLLRDRLRHPVAG
jgi:hypothetical protein